MGAARVDWQAEKRTAKRRARVMTLMSDPAREVTVELWLSSYLELFPSERSVKAEREHLSTLRAFRTEHGQMKMHAVTPLFAQAWAVEHPGQVRHLSRAWRKALLYGVAQTNVWRLVTLPKRDGERVRAPSELELRGILGRCRELAETDAWWLVFADMIEVAAYSGAREGGLVKVRWGAVDLDAGRMVLTEKGGKTRTVALVGPALAAVGRRVDPRLGRMPRELRVFVNRHRQPLRAWTVQDAWRDVRGEFPHGFHSLRHYAATWLQAQGVDPRDVAVQLGHVDAQGRPYTQLQERVYVEPDAEKALRRIERRLAS